MMKVKEAKWLWTLSVIAFIVLVMYVLMPVLPPFLVAFGLAYILHPLVQTLQRYVKYRALAVLLVYVLVIFVVGLAATFLVPKLWSQALYLKAQLPEISQWLDTVLMARINTALGTHYHLMSFNEIMAYVVSFLQQENAVGKAGSVLGSIASSSLSLMAVLGIVFLVPVVLFYYMLDWHANVRQLMKLIPVPWQQRVTVIVKECDEVLSGYVKGQLLDMIILGTIYAVLLSFVGLNVALIIGVVAGLLTIIPYLGFAVGIVAALLASVVQFGFSPLHIGLILLVFLVGNLIEGYILQPYLLGNRIGLSPLWVIFSVIAGGQLGGFLGMLLALPIAAVLRVVFMHLLEAYYQSPLYGAKVTHLSAEASSLMTQQELVESRRDDRPASY